MSVSSSAQWGVSSSSLPGNVRELGQQRQHGAQGRAWGAATLIRTPSRSPSPCTPQVSAVGERTGVGGVSLGPSAFWQMPGTIHLCRSWCRRATGRDVGNEPFSRQFGSTGALKPDRGAAISRRAATTVPPSHHPTVPLEYISWPQGTLGL